MNAVAAPFPASVTVRVPVIDCPSSMVLGLSVTAVTSSGSPHCHLTFTVLAGPTTFTEVDTPDPIAAGGVPVSVATVAVPAGPITPTTVDPYW